MVIQRVLKEMPVYELTVAKSGAKLTKASIDEAECQTTSDCYKVVGNGRQGLRGTAVTLAEFTLQSEQAVGRPIIEATGIARLFSMEVKPFASMRPELYDWIESLPPDRRPPPEPVRPNIFLILEKEFGLLLKPARASFETIQIESVNRRSAN